MYTASECGNALKQVETLKHLGVLFTSDGRRREEIDTRNVKANAVLRELFPFCGNKTGAFKQPKAVSCQSSVCSDPYVWS